MLGAQGLLSVEGSLSCHTCYDTEPRFFRSHPKDLPIQLPLTTHKGMWRIYSNPDPHGLEMFEMYHEIDTWVTSLIRSFYPSIDLAPFHCILGFFPFSLYCLNIISDFQTFRLQYPWGDIICRNTHLVYQHWYRISFTFFDKNDLYISIVFSKKIKDDS
jgi:hypothetical protein